MGDEAGLYDFSDYAPDHPLYSEANKKVIGKMKDEAGGKVVKEFVGLRSKMYSFILHEGGGTIKAKGISRSVVKKTFHHEDFVQVLNTRIPTQAVQHSIRSYQHQLFTVQLRKMALSAYDDKRWLKEDGISSLAYGHKDIESKRKRKATNTLTSDHVKHARTDD